MAWTPPKTDFASGNILTAAQMNAIGENLVVVGTHFIKKQTIGSGVSSVTVTGAFSSSYDNYLVTVTNMDTSGTNNDFFVRLGTSTTRTDYSYGNIFVTTAGSVAGAGAASTADGMSIGFTEDDETNMIFTVMAPFLAQPSSVHGSIANQQYFGVANGWDALAASHTEFTLRVGPGTMTGGEIRVYGYVNG